MKDRQPYVFEGGTQEENHRKFYVRPPKNIHVDSAIVGNINVGYVNQPIFEEPMHIVSVDTLEEFCGYDPQFVALETD